MLENTSSALLLLYDNLILTVRRKNFWGGKCMSFCFVRIEIKNKQENKERSLRFFFFFLRMAIFVNTKKSKFGPNNHDAL